MLGCTKDLPFLQICVKVDGVKILENECTAILVFSDHQLNLMLYWCNPGMLGRLKLFFQVYYLHKPFPFKYILLPEHKYCAQLPVLTCFM